MRQQSRLRALVHAVFHESREGRASEIVGWANGLAACAAGSAVGYTTAWFWGIVAAAVLFALLRLALVNRITVWMAGVVGTLAVGSAGGSLTWLFAHLIERAWAPPIAAVVGALLAASLPGWAYLRMARLRAEDVPDSLLNPLSVRERASEF